jgi:hypothetical protein
MKKQLLKKFSLVRMRGFVLPLTLIVCVIILTIATGISIILAKELYFSKLSRLSQVAYFAADNGLMCATMIDDKYVDPETGLGIFQYNDLVTSQMVLDKVNANRQANGQGTVMLNDIKCATSEIFNSAVTEYAVTPYPEKNGRTTTFKMKMDLGGGDYRCATVVINKSATYRQIISRGFAFCNSTLQYPIERAIVSTSESTGMVSAPPPQVSAVLTSGTSWTVPAGVTSLKIWAIGAGGGGAGATGIDSTAGGAGGAGGIAYKEYAVTPGQVISYTVGAGGNYGLYDTDGSSGGASTVTVAGVTMYGFGGEGGKYNTGASGIGGSGSGGTTNVKGGDGSGASGDSGGGNGGGIGGANGSGASCGGGSGGQAVDVNGLFAVLSANNYPTTGPGAAGDCGGNNANMKNGQTATGVGSGGGGAGFYGGVGGGGGYGGGGGGAAGYTENFVYGGQGGGGIVVISN